MSLNALNTAAAGLKANQAAISVVSQNIANVGTTGYVKRTLTSVSQGPGNSGVASGTINRTLDEAAQKQLRLETSGAAYTRTVSDVRTQLDTLYGTPGAATALDGVFNTFTESLQGLVSDPTSAAARSTVVSTASNLASSIATIAQGVQALRTDTEGLLADDTASANDLLSSIATLNTKIAGTSDDAAKADLLDQRDQKITNLAEYLDIRTSPQGDGTVSVATTSGLTLVERGTATSLSFDGRGTLSPESSYALDPSKRGVGTVTATTPGGARIDLVASNAIRSGSLAAGIELRDKVLPQAQRQLDDLAAGLSRALSDKSAVGAAAREGTATGFDIDLTNLSAGNAITISLKDAAGTQRNLILVPSNRTPAATVDPAGTTDPTATIVPITISRDPAVVRDAIANALGANFTVKTQTGAGAGGLRILSDGGTGAPTILAIGAGVTQSTTATDLQNGQAQVPLFIDGEGKGSLYTGSFDNGSQLTGFAQRITVNPAVSANTASLVKASPTTQASDTTRPQYLYDALTGTDITFSASSGIGGVSAPYTATVQDFAQRIIAAQGAGAATAQNLDEGQSIALNTAQSRYASKSGVSIDEEMSKLIELQTAYSANARVLAAARDMLDTLLRI